MARLSEAQQTEIVVMLARFTKPGKVKAHLKTEYGLDVPIQQIIAYNARSPRFRVAHKWRVIFDAAEKAFIEEVATIPVANKGFRLNLLMEGVMEARDRSNYSLMRELLEQAAKEVGGALTNRREVDLRDDRVMTELSEEERILRLAAIFDKALGNDPKKGETIQ